MSATVKTYYLEMTSPDQLVRSRSRDDGISIVRIEPPMPELNRFFYSAVGGEWYWIDRLGWTYRDWLDYLGSPTVETWVLYVGGVPAGYFELDARSGDPEIAYFGLLPGFIGRGLGGHMLTAAVERAWKMGGRRVWVHTCTLDHPAALPGYQARGFRIYREEVAAVDLPASPPGPWPGAGRRILTAVLSVLLGAVGSWSSL